MPSHDRSQPSARRRPTLSLETLETRALLSHAPVWGWHPSALARTAPAFSFAYRAPVVATPYQNPYLSPAAAAAMMRHSALVSSLAWDHAQAQLTPGGTVGGRRTPPVMVPSLSLIDSGTGLGDVGSVGGGLGTMQGVPVQNPNAGSPYAQGLTPSQVRKAYGIDQLPNQGQGMTIAVVDAYKDPNIVNDAKIFSQQYGLPLLDGVGGNPTLTEVTPPGQPTPGADPGWAGETALDVEWAHAIAPKANILLVETATASGDYLFAAEADAQPYQSGVGYAKNQPGVVVVTNSYGGNEFSGESFYDSSFNQPASHNPVAIFFSTGDSGKNGEYPAYAGNVIAVGGTSLYLGSAQGRYGYEIGWNGSGGGVSGNGGSGSWEAPPAFQTNNGVLFAQRAIPDISLVADANTGVSVYDSYGSGGWTIFGGTSLSSPATAAYIAIVDSGRTSAGANMNSAISSVALNTALYATYKNAYAANFHDIVNGNNGYAAGTGYDLVTGIGTPRNPALYNTLVSA